MKKGTWKIIGIALFTIITFCFVFFNVFSSQELWFGDRMYVQEQPVNNAIKIIGIDDKSLEELGPYQTWNRQKYADLLGALTQNGQSPLLVALDINVFGEMEEESDAALVKEAATIPVVMASYVSFQQKLLVDTAGSTSIDNLYAQSI